jgi:hypothetical protein
MHNNLKSLLGEEILTTYHGLVTTISTISAKDRQLKEIDGTAGKVRVADLIAYQIGWGTLLIYWYEEGINGKTPEMPGEGFTKWDYNGLALHFYTKYHYDGYKQQDAAFHTVVERILTIVEHEYQTGNLDEVGVWPWCTLSSGKQWTLSKWVTVNTISPYKRATRLIT